MSGKIEAPDRGCWAAGGSDRAQGESTPGGSGHWAAQLNADRADVEGKGKAKLINMTTINIE